MSENIELPKGWKWFPVKEIALNIQYGYTESSTSDNVGPKFLRITDIQNNQVHWDSVPYCPISDNVRQKYLLQDGDLVFARTGATVGKSFLIKGSIPDSVYASYLIRLRFPKGISDKYVWYYFQSPYYWNQIIDKQVGIGQPNVNGTTLGRMKIALCPLPEQHRIVAKIEELFSSLDKGIENLKTAQQQLKVYRQAVLKWAFEGKLTNKSVVDGELPEGWKWIRLEAACDKIQDGSHFSPKVQYDEPGKNRFPYITAKNIRNNYMDFTKLTYVDREFHESIYERCNPEYGDVLLTKDGVNTGEVTLNTLKEAFSLLSSVCVFKTKRNELDSGFLKYFLQSPLGSKAVVDSMTGTAIKRIILRKIKEAEIILPPLHEQYSIVSEIESRLSVCDRIEETINESLKQAEALRQSVLKKAFEGKLVPQDPNDEPASELLERIRKNRTETSFKKGKKRSRDGDK